MFGQEIKKVLPTTTLTLLFSGSYFNSKKWSYKKRYRITPFLELKVTPLVVLKCNTTFGAILTPFSGLKI